MCFSVRTKRKVCEESTPDVDKLSIIKGPTVQTIDNGLPNLIEYKVLVKITKYNSAWRTMDMVSTSLKKQSTPAEHKFNLRDRCKRPLLVRSIGI